MLSRRIGPLAVVMLATLGSTGCIEALRATDAVLRLSVAVVEVAAAVSAADRGKGSEPCCYSRENPTPVEGAVDRPMSACEIARGRWREAHQEADDVPPELQCLADGAYPKVPSPAAPARPPAAPAEPAAAPVESAAAPADSGPPGAEAAPGDTI